MVKLKITPRQLEALSYLSRQDLSYTKRRGGSPAQRTTLEKLPPEFVSVAVLYSLRSNGWACVKAVGDHLTWTITTRGKAELFLQGGGGSR